MPYTGAYVDANLVDFTFAENVVLDGTPEMLCISGAGGVIATAISAEIIDANKVRITFNETVYDASHLFFFRSQQTQLRGVTGGWPTNEPVLVLAD